MNGVRWVPEGRVLQTRQKREEMRKEAERGQGVCTGYAWKVVIRCKSAVLIVNNFAINNLRRKYIVICHSKVSAGMSEIYVCYS